MACSFRPLPYWFSKLSRHAKTALIRIGVMLFALVLARNLFWLAHAILYVLSVDTEANRKIVSWAGIGSLFLVFLLACFFIAERMPGHFISLCLALVLCAFIPSVPWPSVEWKLWANKAAYQAVIVRAGSGFAVLEHKEEEFSFSGPWISWLIYDESDETGLPNGRRSEAWKAGKQNLYFVH